jgi:anti-sigma factor RsiW
LQSGHLGDLGAALVDDQLSAELRDQALTHLASCPECQRDVEQQRRLKARLRCLAEPALPLNLALRLNALKAAPVAAPAPSGPPGGGLALAFPVRERSRVLNARRGRLLVGAASLVLFGVGTAAAAAADVQPAATGGTVGTVGTTSTALSTSRTQAVTTSVSQPVSQPVSGSMPLHDPAFDAMNASFVP